MEKEMPTGVPTPEKMKEDFKNAVVEYRNIIEKAYKSSPGDEPDFEVPKSKIIDLFKNSPETLKASLLFILTKNLANPARGE